MVWASHCCGTTCPSGPTLPVQPAPMPVLAPWPPGLLFRLHNVAPPQIGDIVAVRHPYQEAYLAAMRKSLRPQGPRSLYYILTEGILQNCPGEHVCRIKALYFTTGGVGGVISQWMYEDSSHNETGALALGSREGLLEFFGRLTCVSTPREDGSATPESHSHLGLPTRLSCCRCDFR